MAKRNSQPHSAIKKKTIIKKRSALPYLIVTLVLIVIVAGVIVLAKLGKLDFKKPAEATQESQDVAALVNGEQITLKELDAQYESLPAAYQQLTNRNELLNQIIEEKLLMQEIQKNSINVTDTEVDTALDNLLAQNRLTRDQLEQSLSTQGTTLDEFTQVFRKRLLISKFFNQTILDQVRVDQDDARQYYDQNPELFTQPEQVNASHILVNTSAEADEIIQDLEDGADFETLAQEKSLDPSAEFNAGNLGLFGKGMMVKPFEDAAFSLDEGEISEPVQSQFGWHVILVHEKTDAGTVQYEEVEEDIIEALRMQKAQDAFELYLKQLKAGADIKIYYNDTNVTAPQDYVFPIDATDETAGTIEPAEPEEVTPVEPTPEPVEPTESEPVAPEPANENEPVEAAPENVSAEPVQSDSLAACLSQNGAIIYGAYWSKDTQQQLAMFGSQKDKLRYVECGIQGDYAAQAQVCKDSQIDGYPTWKIDGHTELGIQTEARLRALSGC